MYIKVWDDKYVITSDSRCYTLKEIRTKAVKDEDVIEEVSSNEDGTYEIAVAYLNTVAQCFETIVEREGRKNNCKTIDGYIKHLKEIDKKLDDSIATFEKLVGGKDKLARAIYKHMVAEE